METFSLYLLSLAVVLVSFIFLGILSQRYNSNRSKVPPGTFGFPLIGETIQFLASGPEKFFHRRMEKYSGDIFTTSLFGEKVAVVCGAAGNKFLLYTANHQLTPWIPSATFKLLNWMDSAGQSYKQSLSGGRIFLNKEMLKPEILRQYITIMDSLARQHINTYWDPSQVVKVYPLSQKVVLNSNQFAWHHIQSCFERDQNTKAAILEYHCGKEKDCFGEQGKSRFGRIVSHPPGRERQFHVQLRDWCLYCEFNASQLRSSKCISYIVLMYLAELPHIYDMVYKDSLQYVKYMEIAESKAPEELLNLEDIKKMKYSWNVIYEALSLTPPSLVNFREAQTDVNFAGFTIPKGWKVLWSPFTTNKNPKYFHDPETFDPTRYEGDGPTACTFLPFSAGPRMCPGKEYSMFLILVYIYNVVRNFKLQKMIQDEKIQYRVSAVPANGLPIRLQPHNK
ncbi:unnamed protein product [Coffea canephora]|uniref:Beta-amyrin 28-oxidase-like n=2 Tax=Coffea TaxID=13442 RepID=A0A068V9B6_COFCA|nr:unnamed protein product [Coffea canephora]